MKCFYHNADLDGKCSAAIVRRKYPNIELIGINYGDPFPWEIIAPREPIIVVDFSLQPFGDMVRLRELTDALVWIDHHKTALDDAREAGWTAGSNAPHAGCTCHVPGLRRVGIGACALCWEYLFPNELMPEGVRLLAEYDVWNHEDPDCLAFQYGMRSVESDPGSGYWSVIFSDACFINDILQKGQVVLDWEEIQNAIRAKSLCFNTEMDGLQLIAANIGLTNSKLFDSVWDPDKYHAMLTFHWRKGQWTVGLYSTRDDVDVGEAAKARGGGGHKGAAGFQCKDLPFALR